MRKILALAAVGMMLACAGVELPPKAGPEEVELIIPAMGQEAQEGYKTIGPISVALPLGASDQELITLLRTEAAKQGADAVIFQGIRNTTEGDITGDIGRKQERICTGLAIYYPATGS